jgi:ribulose-5-phosphate 4-epimerase/fuculose-1-phosphate aldolase
MVVASDERQDELLAAVRRLEPGQLMRLAGLWAGVSQGALDADRQRRRNAARLALRYVTRREDRILARRRTAAAVAAVATVMAGHGSTLRGPLADAAFAVTDALDAIAHAERLAPIAYEELLRPWRELTEELRSGRE